MSVNHVIEKSAAAMRKAVDGNPRAAQLVQATGSPSPFVRKVARDRLTQDFPAVATALDAAEKDIAKAAGQPRSPLVEMAKARRDELLGGNAR